MSAGERAVRAPAPLGRGVMYNLGGLAAPMAIAVVALPLLATELGPARFGALALVWSTLAYLGLLNLGVGRAIVHATAARPADDPSLRPLVWTALVLLGGIGVVGGVGLYAVAPALAGLLFRTDPGLAAEAAGALRLLAAAVPFTISAAVLTASLEARQRFGVLNLIAVPVSIVNYLAPLLVLRFADGLLPVVAVLLVGRVLAWAAYLAACLAEIPVLRQGVSLDRAVLRPLLAFGGWITVSHVVSPLMMYLDRFLISALISTVALAYYVAPQEAVLRLGVASSAVVVVLFPAFAAAADTRRVVDILERGVAAVYLLLFPAALLLGAFAGEVMRVWMGPGYAGEAAPVLRLLALGLLITGLARIPAALLHGRGRADLTGKLNMAELPLYAGVLWLLTARFGIQGAAVAWVVRVAADGAALGWMAAREVPAARRPLARAARLAGIGVATVGVAPLVPGAGARAAFVLLVLLGFAVFAWARLLGPAGRAAVRAALPRLPGARGAAAVRGPGRHAGNSSPSGVIAGASRTTAPPYGSTGV